MPLSNASGALVLNGQVNAQNFSGPPLVLYGTGLTSTSDSRWQAAANFAALMSAPLVGCASSADLALLWAALLEMAHLWSSSLIGSPPVWTPTLTASPPDTVPLSYPPFCGPILVAPQNPASPADAEAAWDWAATCCRAVEYQPYGIGLMAMGPGPTPWPAPPVYLLVSITGLSTAQILTAIYDVWQQPPVPNPVQYLLLADIETARPGASTYYHPSLLLGYVQTTRP